MDLIAFHNSLSSITNPISGMFDRVVIFYAKVWIDGGLSFWFFHIALIYFIIRMAGFINAFVGGAGGVFFNARMMKMKIIAAEMDVNLDVGPLRISGRADEVRMTENGDWLVGDIKSPMSHEITEEDIASLSIYRNILKRKNPGVKFRKNGYFRLVDPSTGESNFVPVRLHDEVWFKNLTESYIKAKEENRELEGIFEVPVCRGCNFAKKCLDGQNFERNSRSDLKIDDSDYTLFQREYRVNRSTRLLNNMWRQH